jgi:hypothetical protein
MTSRSLSKPSNSSSSASARPDFEESMSQLCDAIKNNNNNSSPEVIQKLYLQVEESFFDFILVQNQNLIWRQARLSHHFLDVSKNSNSISRILNELSSSNQNNNTNNNNISSNQRQKIINDTKTFFETLRNHASSLWNVLEILQEKNDQISETKILSSLRCLCVDLMIASLPSPCSSTSGMKDASFF